MQQEIVDNLFDVPKLRELVNRTTCRELRQCIAKCLTDGSPEPYALLHALLTVLQSHKEDADKDEKVLQIFLSVVRTLADEGLTARNAQDAICTLVTFIPCLKTEEAQELFHAVLSVLRSRAPKSAKIFELLPPLVTHLDLLEVSVDDGNEAEEDDNLFVRTKAANKENLPKGTRADSAVAVMCRGRWCADNTLALASAFSDATLDSGERELLLRRLLGGFAEQEITNLPALVHQVLLIGVKGDPRLALDGIFNFLIDCDHQAASATVASGSNFRSSQDSCPDIISEGPDPLSLVQAEGTILLHFLFAAKQNQSVAKNVLKGIKALLPENCLEPSILGLQLTLMSVPRLEEQFLDHARSSISLVLRVLAKFRQSAWIRSLTSAPSSPLETVMRTVEHCCGGQWDCVCPGLLRLALALLDSGQPKGGHLARPGPGPVQFDPLSEQTILLASRILRLMFKRLPSARSDILEALVRRLISKAQRPTARLYADLVGDLIAKFPHSCLEHSRCVREPLDYLPLLPLSVASSYIHGLLPLLRADIALRNQLMIVLRKALFLRQPEAKAVGTAGLILLLRHFRVVGTLSTQSSISSSQDGNFVCSQVQVHMPLAACNTNDGLCTEVLGLLRRCLDQQGATQRCIIFRGLVQVLVRNKQLAMPVVSILKAHFDRTFESDEDVQPPFRLDCSGEQKEEAHVTAEVIVQLARAVHICTTSILSCGILNETEAEAAALSQLCQEASNCLRSGVLRMTRLGADDVGVSANTSTSETAERLSRSAAIAGTVCDLLDALMEFELHRCEDTISEELLKLFSRREFFRKQIRDSSTTVRAKGRGRAASAPGLLSLASLLIAIRRAFALWAAPESFAGQDATLRQRFLQLLLTMATERLRAKEGLEPEEEEATLLADLTSECLQHYGEALSTLIETADASELPLGRTVMAQALELAELLLTALLDKGEAQIETNIQRIVILKETEDSMTISQLAKRMKGWCEDLLESVSEASVQRDASRLLPLLVRLCQLRVSDNLDWLAELADWLTERLRRAPSARGNLDQTSIKVLLQHALLVTRLAKPGHCLLRELACDMHNRLGDVDQNASLDSSVTFESINSRNAVSLVQVLTSHIDKALDDCDWLLGQLSLAWPVCARRAGKQREEALDELDSQERALCLRLGYLCNALDELVQCGIPFGQHADAVLSCLTRQFNLLASLTRHYLHLVKESIGKFSPKFEKLVRLSGFYLSPHCYAFISFVQTTEMQKARESTEAKGKGKKEKEKSAKGKKLSAVVGVKLSRSVKDSRVIPNLIFSIEQFERFLILLGKRTNTKLMQLVKITTARDFRINQHALAEALAADAEVSEAEDEEEEEEERREEGTQESVNVGTELSFGEASVHEEPRVLKVRAPIARKSRR